MSATLWYNSRISADTTLRDALQQYVDARHARWKAKILRALSKWAKRHTIGPCEVVFPYVPEDSEEFPRFLDTFCRSHSNRVHRVYVIRAWNMEKYDPMEDITVNHKVVHFDVE